MKNWFKSFLFVSGVAVTATSFIACADKQDAAVEQKAAQVQEAVATQVAAEEPQSVETPTTNSEFEVARAKVELVLGLQVDAIAESPVAGLLQVATERGIFYTSEDGKYFLQARVFNLDEGMRNETEAALTSLRLEGLKQFEGSVIEFKAKNERYVVNVFTDITCGYCRKLHNEMQEYNKHGITVRYLAFPRRGIGSEPFDDMVSIWCAADKQEAMTLAKNGESVDPQSCANNVAEQYNFAQRIGVNSTPNVILPDGTLIRGYQPAPDLLEALKTI